MAQALVCCPLQPSLAWQPPGYTRQHLDDRLVELDRKFGPCVEDPDRRRQLGIGSMLHWLREGDLHGLQVGQHLETTGQQLDKKQS